MVISGQARSLSFDLVDQFEALENNGQFRFTPATHSMLAFDQALKELEAEGGAEGRGSRYKDIPNVTGFASPFAGRWLVLWAHGKCGLKTLQWQLGLIRVMFILHSVVWYKQLLSRQGNQENERREEKKKRSLQ